MEDVSCLDSCCIDKWQKLGAKWMVDAVKKVDRHTINKKNSNKHRTFVLADQMGTGKTHQVCAFLASKFQSDSADTRNSHDLIICPKALITTWQDVAQEVLSCRPLVIVPGCVEMCENRSLAAQQVVIMPSSVLTTPVSKSRRIAYQRNEICKFPAWRHVIVDEAHRLLMPRTLACSHVIGRLLPKVSASLWALCGLGNSFHQGGHVHQPRGFRDMCRCLGVQSDRILGRQLDIHISLSDDHLLLNFASQEEAQLYSVLVNDDDRRKFCADPVVFRRSAEYRLTKSTPKSNISTAVAATLTPTRDVALKVQQVVCTRTKTQFVRRLVDDAAPRSKFLIFCKWRLEVQEYVKMLEGADDMLVVLHMDGSSSSACIGDTVDLFSEYQMSEKKVVLVATVLTGASTGLSLQAATHIVITSPFWDEYVIAQALARCVGRKGRCESAKSVQIYRPILRGTVEESWLSRNQAQKITRTLDGVENNDQDF